MRFLQYVVAFVLTVVMLYIARTNSLGEPREVTGEFGGVQLRMVTVPKCYENSDTTITVRLQHLPPSSRVRFCHTTEAGASLEQYACEPMAVGDTTADGIQYAGSISVGKRGGKYYYYFVVTDSLGNVTARLTDPDELPETKPFLLKSFGHLPIPVLAGHLLFIFSTVFFISLATVSAFGARGDERMRYRMMRLLLYATITSFIGMIIFGIPMNYFAFGGYWEGVPFGHDATDNKTQLLFLYLLFATLSGLGTLSRGRWGRDIVAPKTLTGIAVGSFAVMLFIYLIPHSIQFTPAFTYAFCYSWIGLLV
ncbi:MAG: hypothetical protein D6800_13855, partial [Candidatus Zixiibacteriota bacterium]